jgi:PAS domain S-box-containing protein
MPTVIANPEHRELREPPEPRPPNELVDFLDHAPVPIHSLDATGTILWANRAELALLGYRPDEYIGRPFAAFHADPAGLAELNARLARGEALQDHEAPLRCKDGSIRRVLISANPLREGRRGATRCFLHDVTDARRADAEREHVITELTRTVRLNDMFAGILGHDLRGPLSTIVMASQLLLGSIDDPKGVRTIQRVLNSADRMQRMIDQLLDFARARVDGGIELERRTVDIGELARDVIEEIRFARPERKIDVEVQDNVRGDYDAARLSQVFSNLIGNAVQHGAPDQPLRVTLDGRDPALIQIAIENRGTIAPELLAVLFSPVRGSHHKGMRSQGLGLGLFITDHIVRAHGGRIAAESVNGTTVFRFDLPRHANGRSQVATFDAGMSGKRSDRIPTLGIAETASAMTASSSPIDVTALRSQLVQEATRQNEERFRMLVESIRDYAIFMLDADGNVATWNAGAQRIKGYTADEIVGQHFSVFYSEDDNRAGKTERELRIALRDGRYEDEGWRLRKDGTRFWAHVVISTLRDASGTLLGFAKITRDRTESRKLEDERLQLAHAQEAVRLRDEFLSLASHELKTPLTVLQLQLEALRERVDDGDRATIAKLDRSDRARKRLAELVEALLDVSRIATGQFKLHLVEGDVADIVTTAVDRLHETAEAAGCPLAVTVDHVIGMWDRSRIDQVVSNLVSNATRHAAGTPIDVKVTRAPDGVVIEVRDRGPGLPEGQLVRIFERFERGASMRHYGGLGLGLYVVRQITEAHGGCVTARNLPDGGACLTVHLPLTGAAKDPAGPT